MTEKYEKIFKIGSGTFGEAWLVNSVCSGRSYVLKEVKVCDLNAEDLERTQREAEVLARCKHINIIRYKESFLTQGPLTMCLVMEYADGGDLYEREKEAMILNKLLPEASVLHWFIQIIFAVQYLHSNNILHRDLKTKNIFITFTNIIKVGDFGIARFLRSKQDLATTAIGTPYYLSPEICLRRPYNHKSDMWAVGCILYELCSLKHPFEAEDIDNLIMKILHGVYVPLNSSYSRLIHDLTAALLNTNPLNRPTADDILLFPSLRIVVHDYIKRHEKVIASYCSIRKPSCGSPKALINRSEENRGPHTPPVKAKEATQYGKYSNSVVEKDTSDQPRTPKNKKRRDSQTQTPPEWAAADNVTKGNSKTGLSGPELLPKVLQRQMEEQNPGSSLQLLDSDCEFSPTMNKTYTIFRHKV